MLHHAHPPLGGNGGRYARRLLESLSGQKNIRIDFVSISDREIYQTESIGEGVTIHRLNVYKTVEKKITADELYEYQAKSYIFILRTARKVKYDLIHALGIFPECFTAYAFRRKFPYVVTPMPSDAQVAKVMTGGHPEALSSLGREFRRAANRVFKSSLDPAGDAGQFCAQYKELI